jgi:hypothetical protein
MALSMAPFDQWPEPLILRAAVPAPVTTTSGPDRTECNYLVMFFVLGVFLLALIDSM